MRILLIRHGQTPGNVLGQLDTAYPGPGLTTEGIAQAELLNNSLSEIPLEAIYVSTLKRTALTAAPLANARGIDIRELPGVHEIEAGELELRSDRPAIERYLQTIYEWGTGNLDARMPGAGTGAEFFSRFDEALGTVASVHSGSVAVFNHGAAIRVWVSSRAVNVPVTFGVENRLANTGVVIIESDSNGSWQLVEWEGQTPREMGYAS